MNQPVKNGPRRRSSSAGNTATERSSKPTKLSGTREEQVRRNQGRQPKDIPIGIHLLFWGTFQGWLKKKKGAVQLWDEIEDKRSYFIVLSAVALWGRKSKFMRGPLKAIRKTAPELTQMALPPLEARAAKMKPKQMRHGSGRPPRDSEGNIVWDMVNWKYRMALSNPETNNPANPKISQADADLRDDTRKRERDFFLKTYDRRNLLKWL